MRHRLTEEPIEIMKTPDGWKVWFGTFATDRSRTFLTAQDAQTFAKRKFAQMKTRHILYPPEWPL
jgi:hypothetical protein